ncbi:hypothetical protein E3J38_04945 [candidate division TA06 bacterium]|uniref:Flagellar protein FlgN n=1 Tax=candidate division TA06 bacterium TaxID=2250710 RepID=A0A523XNE5_UNCT6|nr:MAG: hypothetical protein E3J38_04945 [candidate division TA06 bacterium]
MGRKFHKKLIERLTEMVDCSDAMNRILKEQQTALTIDDSDSLLQAINDMDECRCQLLDLDKALSDLKASTEFSQQATEMPEVEGLLARVNSLQEENTNLMLSNRELVNTKIRVAPEEIREPLSDMGESALG